MRSTLLFVLCFSAAVPLIGMGEPVAKAVAQALCKCGKEGTLRCGACRTAKYCSVECQRDDWKAHKESCNVKNIYRKTLEAAYKKKEYAKISSNPVLVFTKALDRVDKEVIDALLALRLVNLNTTLLGKNHSSPMFYLVQTNNSNGLAYLIKSYHGQLEVRNFKGLTPLHEACLAGAEDVVRLLLEMGAPHNAPQEQVASDLRAHLDRLFSKEDMVDIIGTPLHAAAMVGELGCVKLLVERGNVEIDKVSGSGITALVRAVQCRKTEVVKYLVAKGASIDALKDTSDGGTLVHQAFTSVSVPDEEERKQLPPVELLRFLIRDCKIDVNGRNNFGEAPLHYVTYYGSAPAAKLLIEVWNADRFAQDPDGRTPLELARHSKINNPHKGSNQYSFDAVLQYLESIDYTKR